MIYKDRTFEICENQIKFKSKTAIIFLAALTPMVITSSILSKGNSVYYIGLALGLVLGLVLAFHFFRIYGMYLKNTNTIDLSNIEYVRIHTWDNNIDKDKKFCETGRHYYFPMGIKNKKMPQVIFHIKGKKAAVGFVPENIENVISVLNEKGITIMTKTHDAE